MINKKQKTKDVFYNNRNYIVPYTSLKHIDGIDVVQINEIDIVIWDNEILVICECFVNIIFLFLNNNFNIQK